ncbi:MAG: hypothetical protein J6Y56_02825 [Fibrobacterales bacterium]|nr:hypothetical protein [Fibrobacterales bacterium]
MKRSHKSAPLPSAALLALAVLASAAFVGCSEDKGTNGGSSSSSAVSSSSEPEYGSPEYWEKDWQESLAYFNCPQPTDTIEGWKLAGLKTGVVPDETDSNLVMQIREHDGTLIIRTFRGDMWTARFPELEWTRIYLPSKASVKRLGSQGDSLFASTRSGELWTAKFKDLAWHKLSPAADSLRKHAPEMTKLIGEAAFQWGDTLFWAVTENVTQAWYDKTNDYIKEVPVYASVGGKWFKTQVEWDTMYVKKDTSGTLPDGVWRFAETRGVLRALTYSKGIWEWNGKQWQKADLLGRGENTPLAPGEVRTEKFYRDIVEHDGKVWIAELDGYIESSSDMANWANHWKNHQWSGLVAEPGGAVHALHPHKDKMLIGTTGGVAQWSEADQEWESIAVKDCFEHKTTRAPRTGYGGWGPPGYVHEFVVIGDTIVAGVADYNYGLSGVYMFDLKEATWR